MNYTTAEKKFMRHGFASLGSCSFLTAIPIILFVVFMLQTDDELGPLNLILIPVGSAIIGLFISVLIYTPLAILRERFSLTYWFVLRVFISGFVLLFALPIIWFYGFRAQSKTPITTISMVLVSAFLYVLIGLIVHFLCFHLHRKLNPIAAQKK